MMIENRYNDFARLLVNHSTQVKSGDVVIIENFDVPTGMTESLVRNVQVAGAHPVVWLKSWGVLRRILSEGNEQEIDIMADAELEQMRKANVYISMRASLNGNELAGVPPEQLEMFQRRGLGRVHYAQRVHNPRWWSANCPT